MQKIRLSSLVTLFAFLVLCSHSSVSQDSFIFSLTTDNETYNFIPQPQLGYVVKSSSNQIATMLLKSSMQGTQVNEEYINVANQPKIVIVLGKKPFVQNQNNMRMLNNQPDTQYIAPIYTLEGYKVAIMPEIIVRLVNKSDFDKLEALCREFDCTIIGNLLYTEQEFLITPTARNAEEVLLITEVLSTVDFVEWAFPNLVSQMELYNQPVIVEPNRIEPNDVYFKNQWHLDVIRAPEAWYYADKTGDPNIIVAVLDTGVDIDHPDLVNNIWTNPNEDPYNDFDDDGNGLTDDVHGWDFYGDNPDVNGDSHGTKCAGLIAAHGNNNETGVTGVTWNCKIMPIRILGSKLINGDRLQATAKEKAAAIRYAARSGADILNISWGGTKIPYIGSAIKDITVEGGIGRNGKGCIVFGASGNSGGSVRYPAKYQEVIAVGAIDVNDVVWNYSCHGSELDIVAPSGCSEKEVCETIYGLWTTSNDGGYTDTMDGTSAACPIVAGVAALILSVDPNLKNSEVRNILLHSARDLDPPGWDEYYGFGCVDAYAAVDMTLNRIEFKLFVDDNAPNDLGPGDPNINDPNEDGSFEHPFDSIQKAINKSIPGDTVIVLSGTYTGEGNHDIDYYGKAITVRSQEGPERCIINCEMQGRGFHFHSGEEQDSILEGFTIKKGQADFGGGVRIANDSSPSITNCTFIKNSANYGGGIYSYYSSPIVTNCTFTENFADTAGGGFNSSDYCNSTITNCNFTNNSAVKGGGMYNGSSNKPVITNCNFTKNTADKYGGGLYNYKSNQPTITNCLFLGNSANVHGGGMYNESASSDQTLTNCMFVGNTADNGGGIYHYYCSPTITNCTITQNMAFSYGGGLYNYKTSNPTIINCIIWANDPIIQIEGKSNVSYSNIQGGWSGEGEGNINTDPLFVNPGFWELNGTPDDPNDDLWINGDYHLKSQAGRWNPSSESWIQDDVNSPCIDAGDPSIPVGVEPTNNGGIINMGAYGGTVEASKSP
jgi:predicted outer membrane repeat protein